MRELLRNTRCQRAARPKLLAAMAIAENVFTAKESARHRRALTVRWMLQDIVEGKKIEFQK